MAYFICSWIQIAKKIISKSKRENDQRHIHPQSRQSSCPPGTRNHANGYPTFGPGNGNAPNMFPISRTFNGSENDLTLNYGRSAFRTSGTHVGGPVRFSPEGRTSPEVQMYKTRVIYHSRQDCASDHEASV